MATGLKLEENFGQGSDYGQIGDFVRKNPSIGYAKFDSSILKEVNLFALPEDFDFPLLSEILDAIIATLPSIKRIFASPITHIKTNSEILPAESVRAINNETIVHASVHSELWEDITSSGLKPRKLLSQDNQDNYAIYENLIFARGIDMILSFVGKNIRFLNDILYSNRDLQFNLLERANHLSYFLSLGKLHTGYVRDYAKYSTQAEGCMDKLLFIDRVLRARLSRPVYRHCRKYSGKLTLKKTNIFRGHKDYHKIYLLLKRFGEMKVEETEQKPFFKDNGEDYFLFTTLLTVFAAGHFNFVFDETPISFKNIDQTARFADWVLNIKRIETELSPALLLSVKKDSVYKILLLPSADTDKAKAKISVAYKNIAADEYLVAAPMADENEPVCLSIYDIDSFRRIQQLLLRAMVYSDFSRNICPFCGQPLSFEEDDFECSSCRTVIKTRRCEISDSIYYTTHIKNFTPKAEEYTENTRRERHSFEKQSTAQLYFRNITKLSPEAEPVCPRCGKIHTN